MISRLIWDLGIPNWRLRCCYFRVITGLRREKAPREGELVRNETQNQNADNFGLRASKRVFGSFHG